MKSVFFCFGFGLTLAMSAAPVVQPARPPELPVETFFRKPTTANLRFSPNGKSLAFMQSIEGRMNIVVLDLEKKTKLLLTNVRGQDVTDYTWVGNERLAFIMDDDGNESFGLYVAGRDGKGFRELAATGLTQAKRGKFHPRSMQLFSLLKNDPDHILVIQYERFPTFPDVYRVDLNTGNKVMVVENPGNVLNWVPDRTGVVRLGLVRDHGKDSVIYRDKDGDKWEKLAQFEPFGESWSPMGFDGDNRTLYVSSDIGRKTAAIYRYDTAQRKMGELVFADETYDLTGIVFSESLQKFVGVVYDAEKPRTQWFNDDYAKYQKIVDAAIPGTRNFIHDATPDGRYLLVISSSDREPGVFYLMDREKRRVDEVAVTRSWIDPEQMAPMKPITFKARDGLLLHGYLTLPVGREAKNLPLVLNPHGGPYGPRDEWGYNAEVQFLANRGYAVLQVNFRGSGGYGREFEQAGYHKWGKEMQDDLTDGVKWAIAEGYADPKRVVILGGSYGGYAVMAGLAYTPELYCAGVNVAGVTDLSLLGEYYSRWPDIVQEEFSHRLFNPKTDHEMIAALSPVNHADKIRAPVFMAYGENDPRVDERHGHLMVSALKKAGKKYEFDFKRNEGHGFRKEENSIELYQKIDAFLKANVPR